MRWLVLVSLFILAILPVSADDWTTVDGKTYQNVTVVLQEDDGVSITYTGGSAKIPYYNLPLKIQKQFGQDPDSLEAKRKSADDAEAAQAAADLTAKMHQDELQKKQAAEAAAAKALADARAAGQNPAPAPPPQPTAPPAPRPPTAGALGDIVSLQDAIRSFDKDKNISYLDSPPANALPIPGYPVPDPQGRHTSLMLRIATRGPEPEYPDQITAIFLYVGTLRLPADNRDVIFLADGVSIQPQKKNNDAIPGFSQVAEYISFYLTPDQARQIAVAKSVNFCVGASNYKLDQEGLGKFRKFLGVMDTLPPEPSYLVRKFHEFIDWLPPITTLISDFCIFIILSCFCVFVFLGLASIWLGLSRFFRMGI